MWGEIWSTLASGGWVMAPLFILSLALYANAWELLVFTGKGRLHHNDDARWSRALESPEQEDETVGAIARYALAHANSAKALIRRFDEMRLALCSTIDRRITFLNILVVLAPLMGLLGTVIGMLATFGGLASTEARTVDTVSQGISQALVTTQTGLMVSLPGLFLVMIARRRRHAIEASLARMENIALSRLQED